MANYIEEKLKEIIVSCSEDMDYCIVGDDTDLVSDLGYNSINLIQLVVALENEFDIVIDDDDLLLEKLSSYQKLVEIIKSKLDNCG